MDVLAVLKEHYGNNVQALAWAEWGEWKQPEGFTFSEEYNQMKQAYDEASNKFKSHPGYNNHEARDESYEQALLELRSFPTSYKQKEKEILEYLGLGSSYKEVASGGGEDKGSDWFRVYHFPDVNVYIQISGYYQSYDGTDFGDFDDAVRLVVPKEIQVTIYE